MITIRPSPHCLAIDVVLERALQLVRAGPYQDRYIAAVPGLDGKPMACSPMREDAILSMTGAIIRAAGSGPKSWATLEWLSTYGFRVGLYGAEPTHREAIDHLSTAIVRFRTHSRVEQARVAKIREGTVDA